MRSVTIDHEIEIDGIEYAISGSAAISGYRKEWNEQGEAWGSPFSQRMSEFVIEDVEVEMKVFGFNASTDSYDQEILEPRIIEKATALAKQFAENEFEDDGEEQ